MAATKAALACAVIQRLRRLAIEFSRDRALEAPWQIGAGPGARAVKKLKLSALTSTHFSSVTRRSAMAKRLLQWRVTALGHQARRRPVMGG